MPTPKFVKGQSGNPKGRPKNKTPATLFRKAIVEDMPAIIETLVELAKGGDVQAAKVLLDRVCPPLKPQALPINIFCSDELPEQGREIIRATVSGEIPPDIGSQLITALARQGNLVELQIAMARLQRIEAHLGVKTA
jgi:hypothetical protein